MLATVALAGGVSSIAASMPVHAAVIPNPVISITTTPPNPQLTDSVRTDVQWCVPDGTTAGDTFDIALPAELIRLPQSFDLRDPAGLIVANVAITGQPATATFTFTNYVDSHVNVCGTAFFESRLSTTLTANTTYVLTYVVNQVMAFTTSITPGASATPTDRSSARKNGFFADTTDECRTIAASCIGWSIESQLGPFQSVTVNDTAAAGLTFECATVSVRLWSVDASGNLMTSFSLASAGATANVQCTTTTLQVIGSNIPAGRLMRVLFRATPQGVNAAGGVTFTNSATVSHVVNSTPVVDNVVTQRRSARVGGDANGVVPGATTTTIAVTTTLPADTTTTVASITPPPDATTTTVLTAVLPPVPPTSPPNTQLPATGANGTLLGVGVVTFLTGAFLMVVATRRRRIA